MRSLRPKGFSFVLLPAEGPEPSSEQLLPMLETGDAAPDGTHTIRCLFDCLYVCVLLAGSLTGLVFVRLHPCSLFMYSSHTTRHVTW